VSKPDKYTESARGQMCQIRIPNVCNHNPATTVFAHIGGAGMGKKGLNIHGSYACSACHDEVDDRTMVYDDRNIIELWHYHGMKRTQIIMVRDGVLVL